jgi:hypothetical protein
MNNYTWPAAADLMDALRPLDRIYVPVKRMARRTGLPLAEVRDVYDRDHDGKINGQEFAVAIDVMEPAKVKAIGDAAYKVVKTRHTAKLEDVYYDGSRRGAAVAVVLSLFAALSLPSAIGAAASGSALGLAVIGGVAVGSFALALGLPALILFPGALVWAVAHHKARRAADAELSRGLR